MSNTIGPIKNFSDIPKITGKDQLINDWIDQTGLPKETVNNLFEHFSLRTDGSLTAINESFTQLKPLFLFICLVKLSLMAINEPLVQIGIASCRERV